MIAAPRRWSTCGLERVVVHRNRRASGSDLAMGRSGTFMPASPTAPLPRSDAALSSPTLRHCLLACLSFVVPTLATVPVVAQVPASREQVCPDDYRPAGRIAAIGPAGDLVLDDGAVLRLAGIVLLAEPGGGTLREFVGREVTFATADTVPPRDRHGRRAGLVRLGDARETVQEGLLSRGLALVRPETALPGCLPVFLAAEAEARRAGRGQWAGLPLPAVDIEAILERRGRFTIVAGRVLSVGNTRALSYLNFGPVWRQDMTGRVMAPVRIALEARGTSLADLVGRRVTLRGTVLEAGGPAIELSRVEQIEWDEDPATERMGGR